MNKTILTIALFTVFSSCSNMEADADKACKLITQTVELMPEVMQLGIQSAFSDGESKKKAEEKLSEIESQVKYMALELAFISNKYDEYKFQEYLLDNCATAKNLKEVGQVLKLID